MVVLILILLVFAETDAPFIYRRFYDTSSCLNGKDIYFLFDGKNHFTIKLAGVRVKNA
jgi:hypothetical protein